MDQGPGCGSASILHGAGHLGGHSRPLSQYHGPSYYCSGAVAVAVGKEAGQSEVCGWWESDGEGGGRG